MYIGCQYLCRTTKIQILKLLVLPVLLYGVETWMQRDLQRQIDAFGTSAYAESWDIA